MTVKWRDVIRAIRVYNLRKTNQRRNIGFIEAYNLGADVIATVDDDNIPYENWGQNLYVGLETECDHYEAENGVFDPLSVTNSNFLWHRGYPVELILSLLKAG